MEVKPKIKVYARAMNRIALGIMHAFMKIYPNCTLEDLKRIFPPTMFKKVDGDRLYAVKQFGVFKTINEIQEIAKTNKGNFHFKKEKEILKTSDGVSFCVTNSWGYDALKILIMHVKKYGIEYGTNYPSYKRLNHGRFHIELLVPEEELVEKNLPNFPVNEETFNSYVKSNIDLGQDLNNDDNDDDIIEVNISNEEKKITIDLGQDLDNDDNDDDIIEVNISNEEKKITKDIVKNNNYRSDKDDANIYYYIKEVKDDSKKEEIRSSIKRILKWLFYFIVIWTLIVFILQIIQKIFE